MTNFPPETYLAAARIAGKRRPNEPGEWKIQGSRVALCHKNGSPIRFFDPRVSNSNYRALREALDKEHRITIEWHDSTNRWVSYRRNQGINEIIQTMFDDDITRLMMKNVVELLEKEVIKWPR